MPGLIGLGNEKQLFLDEYLVERITGARQVLHLPEKAGPRPIVPSDRPWEGNSQVMRTVLQDPQDGLYKMWYQTSNVVSRRDSGTDLFLRHEPQVLTSFPVHPDQGRAKPAGMPAHGTIGKQGKRVGVVFFFKGADV